MKGLHLCFLCLMLCQVQFVVCQAEGSILSRVLRSITPPTYETTATLHPYVPLNGPKTPFLGSLSERLSVGKIIRIYGYIPADVTRFQVNLCDDCRNGPLHYHFDVRFFADAVVQNTYLSSGWQIEERDTVTGETFPFQKDAQFVLQFEVTPEAYAVSLNGVLRWKYRHRVPYSTADTLEIREGPIIIWKIEYTDTAHEAVNQKYQLTEAGGPSLEVLTMDLRCECKPLNSTFSGSGSSGKM